MKSWPLRLICLTALLFSAACSTNTTFVYKPSVPTVGGQMLPLKVAVLPFKDGTEDFTKRGSVFDPETLCYNMAKAGIGGQITALTPELWAKAFADELTAAGIFQSVRFIYDPAELTDEDLYVMGTLEKAIVAGAMDSASEFALSLWTVRRTDNQMTWEKVVSRKWKYPPAMYEGCGTFSIQCRVDRFHAHANRVMQAMLTEAAADLVGMLATTSGSRGKAVERKHAQPQALESVDETIEGILNGGR